MGNKLVVVFVAVILLFFIFSPLAVASERPSLFEMLAFYKAKLGKPDYIGVNFDLLDWSWATRIYVWDDRFAVEFLWRKGKGWIIIDMKNLEPWSA